MATLIRKTAVVKKGGRIELQSDDLPEGRRVVVTIEVPDLERRGRKLADMIGTGTGLFKTVEEVDAYINEERDSWDR